MARAPDSVETEPEATPESRGRAPNRTDLGFIVLWSAEDPEHIGAWLALGTAADDRPRIVGRGAARAEDDFIRLQPVRQRPGINETLPPFGAGALSRSQLLVRPGGPDRLEVENVGRCQLRVGGQPAVKTQVGRGDVLEVGGQLVLLCAVRPSVIPKVSFGSVQPFGCADAHGYVGESLAAWKLRSEIEAIAQRPGHVLVLGASGTGKELVATALHVLSGRTGPLVARNAATLPEALVDAELFGNLKGYPNPGMPERKGLIGAADGGSLFLDEFGDLPRNAQAHLLRVLDAGEYQRLGETTVRRAEFRLIAATNRPESALRPDVLARFDFRLRAPDLSERVEDLPFIARRLLQTMTEGDAALQRRAFSERGWPRLSTGFVRRAAEHHFEANVRALRAVLWLALPETEGDPFVWPPSTEAFGATETEEIEASRLRRVLAENNGSIEKSWRALGLSSRYAMARLLKKHGIAVTRQPKRG